MAGLLDYYRQHPELWAENEYLLKKDPAYNLGLMDLTKMNLEERRGGKPMTGLTKFLGSTLPNVFLPESMEQSSFSPVVSPLGSYSPSRGDIDLYAGAFTEGDVPTSYGEEEYRPVYNLDKAQIMAHENRHALTNMYPELSEAQPSWSTLDPEKRSLTFGKRTGDPTSYHWMTEAFNRYLDSLNYPAIPFRTPSAASYPVGLSGINRIGGIEPTDMYFDKIWREHWEPYAEKYEKTLEKIAASPRNVSGTPIVPMDNEDEEDTAWENFQRSEIMKDLFQKRRNIPGTPIVPVGDVSVAPAGGITNIVATGGGGGGFSPQLDPGSPGSAPSWRGATAAREAAGKSVAGPGFGRGAYWAKGGLIDKPLSGRSRDI